LKNLKYPLIYIFLLFTFLSLFSCTNEDNVVVDQSENTINEFEDFDETEDFTPIGTIELFNESKIDSNYILLNDAASNRAFIMNKQAKILYEWKLSNNIGNDVYLLPDGNLIASLEADNPKIPLGGKGGKIQLISPNNNINWEFVYSSQQGEIHHDVEMLPNGNILAMVWEKLDAEIAIEEGYMNFEDIYPESIIEIDPKTDSIVWKWSSMNHLIQDFDETKSNFGSISDNPNLIDINYSSKATLLPEVQGDIMHANGLSYDQINDLIFLSVNSYSEVWVIDHSTTIDEAASNSGGTYNKGGGLVYRFGNPNAYGNTKGQRLFYNNHYPNLLKDDNTGEILIFSNGNHIKQSTVYRLQLPSTFNLNTNYDNEPEIIWSYTDPDLYSGKVSGADILENGNILITEGDFGVWEVTTDKEVVWKFSGEGFYWRAYHYTKDSPTMQILGL